MPANIEYKAISILVFLASLFIFFCCKLYVDKFKYLHSVCKLDIVAVICEIEEKLTETDEGGYIKSYYPIFLYMVHGKQYRAKSPVDFPICKHKVGDEIKLKCNPVNPEEILVFTDTARKTFFLFYATGLFFLISSIVLWVAS